MCRFRPARSTSRSSTSASDAPVRGDGRRIARPPRAEAGVTNIPIFRFFYGTALVRSFFLLPLPSNAEKTPAPMCGRSVTAPNHDRNPAPTTFCRADARDPVCRRHRAADPHLHGGSAALRRLLPGSRCGDDGRRTTAPSRRGTTSTTSASAPTWALQSPNRSSVPWCSACSRRSSRAAGAARCSGCSRCGPLRVSDPAESSFGRSFPSLFIFRFMPRGRFRAVHPFQRHISTL